MTDIIFSQVHDDGPLIWQVSYKTYVLEPWPKETSITYYDIGEGPIVPGRVIEI